MEVDVEPLGRDFLAEVSAMRRAMKVVQVRSRHQAQKALVDRKRSESQSQRHDLVLRALHAGLRQERQSILSAAQRHCKQDRDSWQRAQRASARERQRKREDDDNSIKRAAAAAPREPKSFVCNQCDRTFPALMYLLLHQSSSGSCCSTNAHRASPRPQRTDDRDSAESKARRRPRRGTALPANSLSGPYASSAGHETHRTSFGCAIPEGPRFTSAYDILGIARSATDDEIRAAVRRRLLETHPDKNLGDAGAAQDRFIAVQEARRLLEHPARRRALDAQLDGLHARELVDPAYN